eukprot:921296_1
MLETRHDKVSLFEQRNKMDVDEDGDHNEDGSMIDGDMKITEVTKSNPMGGGRNGDDDELEDNIISHVVEKHFEYIANHFLISKDSSNVNDIRDIDDEEEDDDELESVARAGEGGKKYVL